MMHTFWKKNSEKKILIFSHNSPSYIQLAVQNYFDDNTKKILTNHVI